MGQAPDSFKGKFVVFDRCVSPCVSTGRERGLVLTTAHIIRIAYLVGAGCSLDEIMEDLDMTDTSIVRMHMKHYSLELQTRSAGVRTLPVQVGPQTYEQLLVAAAGREIVGRDRARKLLQRIVHQIGQCPELIDNILEDRVDDKV